MNKRLLFIPVVLAAAAAFWLLRRPASAGAGPLVLYGNVDIRDVNLGFRVGGRLLRLAVDEGDAVRQGQVLGRLDSDVYDQEAAQAEASVGSLRAKLAMLEAGYRAEEIAQARAAVAERRADLADAERILVRQTQLRGSGASAEKAYDDALAARDGDAARLNSSEQSLRLYESGYRPEEIAQARADLAAGQAALAQARVRQADTVLSAPSDGVILTRAAEPGAILAEGSTVFTLSLDKPVWIRAYVAELDLGRIHPGTLVEIANDSRPDRPYHGRVGFISPTAEFTPKNVETPDLRTDLVYRLRIVVDDADPGLRQGMPVTARLTSADGAVARN